MLRARDDYERGALDALASLVSRLPVWDSRRQWAQEKVEEAIRVHRRELDMQEGLGAVECG
jgi:hypothetical protein